MKGLLVYPLNKSNPQFIGLQKKMLSQREAFEKHCFIDIINFDEQGIYLNDQMVIPFGKGRINYWVGCYMKLYTGIFQVISPSNYDFIYIRYPLATPFFASFLRRWKRKSPVVPIYVEIPTLPYRKETGTFLRKLLMLSDYLFFGAVNRLTTKFIIHNELPKSLKINYYLMGNGVKSCEMLNFVQTNNFILTGIANLSNYHGYDRIIRGMYQYYNSDYPRQMNVVFKIIGDGQEKDALVQLTQQLGLTNYIHFLGTLHGGALDQELSTTTLGVSTLAWHRVGVSNDGSLKSREYCMKGLPFVTCADDQDFPVSLIGRLNVGLQDDSVDIDALIRFYQNLPSSTSVKMHRFALANLTWESKINQFIRHEF